jgi:DedD protein
LPPPARTVAKVAPNGHWVVQVGSFAQPEYAQQLAGKLRASGLPVFTRLGAKQLTRVYIGPIASQQQAQKIQQRVQDKFQISGLVRETGH